MWILSKLALKHKSVMITVYIHWVLISHVLTSLLISYFHKQTKFQHRGRILKQIETNEKSNAKLPVISAQYQNLRMVLKIYEKLFLEIVQNWVNSIFWEELQIICRTCQICYKQGTYHYFPNEEQREDNISGKIMIFNK
jgi:hypothetical protein